MTFPILISEKLTLRQLSIDDQDAILALRSDPKVNRYLDRAPTKTVDDAINFINKVNENIEKGIALYWANGNKYVCGYRLPILFFNREEKL